MSSSEFYHGLFVRHTGQDGRPHLLPSDSKPSAVPCPTTGRLLRISTVEANAHAICPACATHGHGGFVSFEGDLRMAYACPQCRQLVWTKGM